MRGKIFLGHVFEVLHHWFWPPTQTFSYTTESPFACETKRTKPKVFLWSCRAGRPRIHRSRTRQSSTSTAVFFAHCYAGLRPDTEPVEGLHEAKRPRQVGTAYPLKHCSKRVVRHDPPAYKCPRYPSGPSMLISSARAQCRRSQLSSMFFFFCTRNTDPLLQEALTKGKREEEVVYRCE